MTMTADAPKRYLTRHITYRIPILGRIAREVVEGDDDNPLYAVAMVASIWASAVLLFGYAGLIIPALILAATVFLTILRISLG